MKKEVLLFLLILLVACQETKEFQVRSIPTDHVIVPNVRPEINRTIIEEEPEYPDIKKEDVPKQVDLENPKESYEFEVTYGQLIGPNHTVGAYPTTSYPYFFTKYEFPELLRSRNIRGSITPAMGSYEQFLRLAGGQVLFTQDEEDNVGDFLVYRDNEPIYEYELHLNVGSFLDYIEEELWVLNNPYIIKTVTKKDIVLIHRETGDTVVIGGGSININGEVIEDTDSRMLGGSIFIVAKADAEIEGDDIFIAPGHSLQEYLGEPTLLTDLFDIRYEGVNEVPLTQFYFKNDKEEIELRVTSPQGLVTKIPIGFLGGPGWRLGDQEGQLHVIEGLNSSDFKVKIDDYFILSTPAMNRNTIYERSIGNMSGTLSAIMQYRKINTRENIIELSNKQGLVVESYYFGDPGSNATGDIFMGGNRFRYVIGNATDNYPLSIDLTGNGVIASEKVTLVMDDAILEFPDAEVFNDSANLTLRLFNFDFYELKEEVMVLQINPDNPFTITVYADLDIRSYKNDNKDALSNFGTYYLFLNQEGPDTFEDIKIFHPLIHRFAKIKVEGR